MGSLDSFSLGYSLNRINSLLSATDTATKEKLQMYVEMDKAGCIF